MDNDSFEFTDTQMRDTELAMFDYGVISDVAEISSYPDTRSHDESRDADHDAWCDIQSFSMGTVTSTEEAALTEYVGLISI